MTRKDFQDMPCYILAGGRHSRDRDFQDEGGVTRLEKGYRRYAAVFENVTLVLKKDQAREHYLNYPHVCDDQPDFSELSGLHTVLNKTESDVVFVGSSEITDFPLELIVNLVRNYRGEMYLGYRAPNQPDSRPQPLFGIYHRSLAPKIREAMTEGPAALTSLTESSGRTIPLPDGVPADRIGMDHD